MCRAGAGAVEVRKSERAWTPSWQARLRFVRSQLPFTRPTPRRIPPSLLLPSCDRTFYCEGCFGVPFAHYEACTGAPNMDNWGDDPWADTTDNAKTPTKTAVTSPLPPAFAPAPALLNGFLDDAGWGNDEESFGDWSAAPTPIVEDVVHKGPSMSDTYTPNTFEHGLGDVGWPGEERKEHVTSSLEDDWAGLRLDAPEDDEKVVSETSDSSTTIQPDTGPEGAPTSPSPRVTPDDNSSTRASSPSETSHNDVPLDSPRTSYEEERGTTKVTSTSGEGHDDSAGTELVSSTERPVCASSEDKAEEETSGRNSPAYDGNNNEESASSATKSSIETSDPSSVSSEHASAASPASQTRPPQTAATFLVDQDLLRELLVPAKEFKNPDEAADDPIFSTSARKAWYRLTRKQTMREFNNGNDDDNYIRVTWANSNIRSEVDKVVSRWAREDRLSGRGPGARASFYWDTPAPTESRPASMYARQQASRPISNVIAPVHGVPQPLSTNVPAAFNWSSPSTSIDPWHQAGLAPQATSPIVLSLQPSAIEMQGSDSRIGNMDPTSHKSNSANGMQTASAVDETPVAASLNSPPPFKSDSIAPSSDPWNGLDAFDTASAPKEQLVDASVDNDDEWGEMVSTSTVPTPVAIATTSQTNLINNFATPATPPHLVKPTSYPDDSPDAMHAAPIVRLRSTISPTSALFKANSFVPLGAEQGPVGPGILKSSKRLASINAEKAIEKQAPVIQQAPAVAAKEVDTSIVHASDDLAAWQTSDLEAPRDETSQNGAPLVDTRQQSQEPPRSSTPPPQTVESAQTNPDAWADADFSFFESAPPVSTPKQRKRDFSDPLSKFESPPRSTSSASSAKTFTRSPPRKITPPPVQPLTGATSSAQRRKNEEDQIIHDILSGLPDLSYMLR